MKFLSSLNTMFVLAAVAMVTFFSSCEKEDLSVNVKPVEPINAKAVISANVIAIFDGVSKVVTSDPACVIKYTPASEFEGNPNLAASTAVVEATYDGVTASVTVNVPALNAGQFANITPTIVLYKETPEKPDTETRLETFSKETVTPVDKEVYEDNQSDYWYNTKATYIKKSGHKLVGEPKFFTDDLIYKASIQSYINSLGSTYAEEKVTVDNVPVYSHSRTYFRVTYTITKTKYEVIEKTIEVPTKAGDSEKLIATFEFEDYATSTYSIVDNQVIPGHGHAPAGHGHGHDHGHGHGSGNAGGGIVLPD